MHIKKITFSILVLAIASFIFNGITVSALPHQIIKQGSKSLYGDEIFKDSIKQTGTTYFNMHTVNYDNSSIAAFCAKFDLEAPLSGTILCKNDWNNEKIKASIGSIIQEFRKCKQGYNANEKQYQQCYFLTSVAIHKFIKEKVDPSDIIPNPLNGARISGNSNNSSFNGKTVSYFYNVGIDTYEKYLSNLIINVKKKNYKKINNSNDQYQLSVDAETNTDDIIPSYQITECENAKITDKSNNTIQINNIYKEAKCKVKITATGPTYYYAEKFSHYTDEKQCEGKITGQPLIPNKLTKKMITSEKVVTITIPPIDIKGKVVFNLSTCDTTQNIKSATVVMNNQTKTANKSGIVTFSDLPIGSYDYTVTLGSEIKKGKVKITRSKNNKSRNISFGNCANQPPQSCEDTLDNVLEEFENNGDYDKYKQNLNGLYQTYKYSKLQDLENPACKDEKEKPEINLTCNESTITMKQIKFKNSKSEIVCTANFGLDSPVIGSQTEVKDGTMLWASNDGNIINGILTLNCSTLTNSEPILLTSEQIESILPSIHLKTNKINLELKKSINVVAGITLRAGRNESVNITYSYPNKYNSYIGSGIVTKKACTNCIDIGYGIPLILNDKQENNKGIIELAFKENDYYEVPEESTKSVECPYNIIKYDYLERQIAYQSPFGTRKSTGSNWCNMSYQKNMQVENDIDITTTESSNPIEDIEEQNDIKIETDTNTASCTTDINNNIMIKTYINDRPNSDTRDNKYVMYSFTLTPENLKKIREYNKNYQYNDYKNLNCNNSGICFSKFLTDTFAGQYSAKSDGYCKGTRKDSLCVPKTIKGGS